MLNAELSGEEAVAVDKRKAVVVLAISAAAVLGIFGREGFVSVAGSPLPGDVPTYGYGSTRHVDGTSVVAGEMITEPEARTLAEGQIRDVYEAGTATARLLSCNSEICLSLFSASCLALS